MPVDHSYKKIVWISGHRRHSCNKKIIWLGTSGVPKLNSMHYTFIIHGMLVVALQTLKADVVDIAC